MTMWGIVGVAAFVMVAMCLASLGGKPHDGEDQQ